MNSDRVDAKTKAVIREGFALCTYGLVDRIRQRTIFRAGRNLVIGSLIEREPRLPLTGECSELRDALSWWLQGRTDLVLYHANGEEPRYFFGDNQNHAYLIAVTREDFTERGTLDAARGGWVVDPSFGYIARFSESGYTMKNASLELPKPKAVHEVLRPEEDIPLLVRNGTLVRLSCMPQSIYSIGIGFQEIGQQTLTLPIESTETRDAAEKLGISSLVPGIMFRTKRLTATPFLTPLPSAESPPWPQTRAG